MKNIFNLGIRNNKLVIIITLVLALIVLSFIYVSFFLPTIPSQQGLEPTQEEVSFDDNRPQAGKDYQLLLPDYEKRTQESLVTTALIKKLPYHGTNFSLDYSFSTYKFTLILVGGRESA